MLTGQETFTGKDVTDLIVNLLLEEPVPVVKLRPDVPAKLVQLLTRLLAKQVDQRPNHADEVVEALQAMRLCKRSKRICLPPTNYSHGPLVFPNRLSP